MSIFSLLNYGAWALSAVFAFLVAKDVVRVEKQRKKENEESKNKEN